MKGLFISQQFEFRLETPKDIFTQGDLLPCVLSVKNHASINRAVSEFYLELAVGDPRKVKESGSNALVCIDSADLQLPWSLNSQEQRTFTHTFNLAGDCTISDKSQTLFLVFGPRGETLGRLPLAVQPHPQFLEILQLIETAFQFVIKGLRSVDGWVEAKLKPSTAQRFATLSELTLGFKFEGTDLLMHYQFGLKKLETGAQSLSVKKSKSEYEQRLTSRQFMLTPQHINNEAVEAAVLEALEKIAIKL